MPGINDRGIDGSSETTASKILQPVTAIATGSSFLDIDISSNRGRARSEQAKRVFLAELVARRNENGAR